jgi:hypothetical protein
MRFHESSYGGTPRTHRIGGIALFTLMLLPTAPAFGAPLYIDFGSYSAAPSSLFGAAADVAGAWNNVSELGTMSDLLDIFGNSSGVSITVAAASMNGTGGFGTTDPIRLMQDNFYSTPDTVWSVSFAGLTSGVYDVYLYEPMNQFLGTGGGSVNDTTFASINGGFTGTFTLGVNYLLLPDILVMNGILTARGTQAGGLSGLAGMQLVAKGGAPTPVPEPGTLALLAAALATTTFRSRRLRG